MKRVFSALALISMMGTTGLFAQGPQHATLRSPNGEATISTILIETNLYVAADEFVVALNGTIERDGPGYNVTLLGRRGAFGTDSQFGVVRDELIPMPGLPVVVETRPFVSWEFFRAFIANSGELILNWDPVEMVFSIDEHIRDVLDARVSVVQIDDVSKLVLQVEKKTEFAVARTDSGYIIRLGNPIRAQAEEFNFHNPHISKLTIKEHNVTLQLSGEDIVGSWYSLDEPFRVVMDLKKGIAPMTPPRPGSGPRRKLPGIRTIVIDPGHGGSEAGATGPSGLLEKDMTLALSRKLASMIRSRMPVRVILTRNADDNIDLTQRTAIANEYAADLFVSIHLNSSLRTGARGTETYFLSLEASDDLAREAAERENKGASSAPDPSADLKLILWDLAQQQYLKDSSQFAEAVQLELSRATNTENRGVKQAPFRVLIGATMPAALVEVGFISNPDEETKLADDEYQTRLAEAIFSGIDRFKAAYEERIGIRPTKPPAPTPEGTATASTPSESQDR